MEEKQIIGFASWEELHANVTPERQSWFYDSNDDDLDLWLAAHAPEPLRILDVGCGSGTQAIAMARDGYHVTGIDISKTAVANARRRARKQNVSCRFLARDVLAPDLHCRFDLVFDRGCFHCVRPDERRLYAKVIYGLLDSSGTALIKSMSDKEPGRWGPYRIDREVIQSAFGDYFDILNVAETVYQGLFAELRGRHPEAYFVELRPLGEQTTA